MGEDDWRYIAAAHLVNCPTEPAINALKRAVEQTDPVLENRIVRRKAGRDLRSVCKPSQPLPGD